MIDKSLIRNLFKATAVIGLLLIFTGCLVREENIIIDENGNSSINFKIEGEIEKEQTSFAFPTDDNWNISENSIKKSRSDKYKVNFKAQKEIKLNESWPSSFVVDNTDKVYLDFPTTVRVFKEGNRTFYEFSRRYTGRKNFHAEYIYNDEDAQKLENKIFEEGLFNVPENDRMNYLNNLAYKLAYHNWRTLIDVLGQMVRTDEIKVVDKQIIQKEAQPTLEKIFNTDIFIEVLSDEAKIAHGLGFLDDESDALFEKLFINQIGQNKSKLKNFKDILKRQRLAFDISEEISTHQFSISVQFPGEVIETNGAIDPETPNMIYWIFKGSDLQDKEINLYALSVVEQ